MMSDTKLNHWLDLWASPMYNWQLCEAGGSNFYYRRLGMVESTFDVDGTDFEGRADIHPRLTVELRTSLDDAGLKDRITKCWAVMRHRHILMSSRALQAREFLPQTGGTCWLDKYFVYCVPGDEEAILDGGRQTITFLDDFYPRLDADEFWNHTVNCSRILDEKQHLAQIFILPLEHTASDTIRLRIYMIAAHQIADGLTIYRWSADFVKLLNASIQDLDHMMKSLSSRSQALQRLPPPQEALYPPLPANNARLRWKWLITRILRHVRIPVPKSFQNPLRRETPLDHAIDLPQKYAKVLRYLPKPPLNTYAVGLDISERATRNLINLCRQAGISRGSGSFVLVALVMMRLEERYRPDIALEDRLPFVGSFPVNPRPFLSGSPTSGNEDSVMLAFSEGVTLPFLPSSCDLLTSFLVLGRLAHRQLSQYQKRKKDVERPEPQNSRSPGQLLPTLYLATMERIEGRLSPERRVGLNPQGQYQAKPSGSLATCGISSLGDISGLMPKGLYDVSKLNGKDMVADFRDLRSSVRAREGEFLVGSAGSKHHQSFLVSYDGSTLDLERVAEWKEMLLNLLEFDMEAEGEKQTTKVSRLARAPKL